MRVLQCARSGFFHQSSEQCGFEVFANDAVLRGLAVAPCGWTQRSTPSRTEPGSRADEDVADLAACCQSAEPQELTDASTSRGFAPESVRLRVWRNEDPNRARRALAISLGLICVMGGGFVIGTAFTGQVSDRKDARMRLASGGHGVETTSLAVSPTGSMIATTDTLGRVALWAHDGEWYIDRFLDSTDHASAVAFSPDGQRLAVGANEAELSLWNLTSNPPARTEQYASAAERISRIRRTARAWRW